MKRKYLHVIIHGSSNDWFQLIVKNVGSNDAQEITHERGKLGGSTTPIIELGFDPSTHKLRVDVFQLKCMIHWLQKGNSNFQAKWKLIL